MLILLPLSALATVALLSVAAPLAQASGGAAPVRSVTVRTGDTLWGIAERVAPDVDPHDTVFAVEPAHHLTDAAVVPGQVLRLP